MECWQTDNVSSVFEALLSLKNKSTIFVLTFWDISEYVECEIMLDILGSVIFMKENFTNPFESFLQTLTKLVEN